MRVKIGTYNIAHGCGVASNRWQGGSMSHRSYRLMAIAALIKDMDVVVLNEADFSAPWSFWIHNHETIMKGLADFKYSMSVENSTVGWQSGNVILSRYPLSNREIIALPQHSPVAGFRRDALAATVTPPNGKAFKIVAVHLDWHSFSRVRRLSILALFSYMQKQTLPVVIAGDFNSTPFSFPHCQDLNPTALDIMIQSKAFITHPMVHPLPETLTFPSYDPKLVLDWIFVPTFWKILDYRTRDVLFSDHRPILAEFETG
ncbi:MAG: endonuclease/exonuclease/phosphatase family protein [Candidatus Vogelbacteria bacterium]|nr:endonuclease/exonuclease/phosphatase family protein [Candidatus Vogelbacteria bacterium]